MNEPKIPVFLAVGLWSASALAVLSYTAIAFKQTAKGLEGVAALELSAGGNALVATSDLIEAETGPFKPLTRGKFKPSR